MPLIVIISFNNNYSLSPLDLSDKEEKITRSEFLDHLKGVAVSSPLIGALIGGVVSSIAGCKKEKKPKKSRKSPEEVPETKAITLGNVRFVLDEIPQNLSSSERERVFLNFKTAYQKLVDYFGIEQMTFEESLTLPINIKKDLHPEGQIAFHENITLNDEGEVKSHDSLVIDEFVLRSIEEDNIAHEMVHLFLQKLSFYSMAFVEGHAHAIQNLLFDVKGRENSPISAPESDGVSEVLNIGLDFNRLDLDPYNGGIRDELLNMIAQGKWARAWKEFVELHPNFLKDFYKKINELRKNGKKFFLKKDLQSVASHVSTAFDQWFIHGEGRSLQELGEGGVSLVFEAIRLPEEQALILFNFQTRPRNFYAGKVYPNGVLPVKALDRISIFNPITGKTSDLQGMDPSKKVIKIEGIPTELLNHKNLRIFIGEVEISIK